MPSIVLITTSFPHSQPGSEAAGTFVADFARELAKFAEVAVLAPGETAQTDSHDEPAVYRYYSPGMPLSQLSVTNVGHWLSLIHVLYSGAAVLNRLLRMRKVDHILVFWALPGGYWARRIWRTRGLSYSIWALGSDIWKLGTMPLVRSMLTCVLRDAAHCFADGFELKNSVERLSGRTCQFLPSCRQLPVSGRHRYKQRPPYRLSYLGRWHPHKGVDLLLEALCMLPDRAWGGIEDVRIYGGGVLE
jgi:glycosyltransferase involved in cell wall biosynthesis